MGLILENFSVKNYKNFKKFSLKDIKKLSVLIGSNGVGKSNFLSIIEFISSAFRGGLKKYFDHKGIQFSDCIHQWNLDNHISLEMNFKNTKDSKLYHYQFALQYDVQEGFKVINEQFINHSKGLLKNYSQTNITALELNNMKDSCSLEEKMIHRFLSDIVCYSFYNTFFFLKNMTFSTEVENKRLQNDGKNFAGILLSIRDNYPNSYLRIVDILKRIINSFVDFAFVEIEGNLYLKFTMKTSKRPLAVNVLSDGTLRFIFLCVLLNLPQHMRPSMLLLEEPEVSLHPHAINILGDMVDSYAQDNQIMIATQSPYLLNRLEVDSIYVLHMNDDAQTEIKQVDKEKFKDWLDKYPVGDLWLMNLFGGGSI